MTLDSWLVARLAAELAKTLAGARINTVRSNRNGLLADCYRRGAKRTLRAYLDPEAPLVTASESGEAIKESGAGSWTGGVAGLLEGSTIDAVRAVPNDRILNIDVSSRSPFGVPARHRITIELQPRMSNALVLRPTPDGEQFVILAACRRFENAAGARDVAIGRRYEAPPAQRAQLTPEEFAREVERSAGDPRALARLLGRLDPRCTMPLAREVVASSREVARAQLADGLLRRWLELLDTVQARAVDLGEPLYVYVSPEGTRVCHLVPLSWAPGKPAVERSLLAVCASQIAQAIRKRRAPAGLALRKRLTEMLARCAEESERLQQALAAADAADELRAAGDAIYSSLADIPTGASALTAPEGRTIALDPSLSAKANAAQYFKRYRKARSGRARIAARLDALTQNKEFWEQLVWELDRADTATPAERDSEYADVADAIGGAKRRPARVVRRRTRAQSAPIALAGGATAYVGRSAKDNERITFMLARPNDFWFHARGMPGAHVIVKPASTGRDLTPKQIEAAAALAAANSRAAGSGIVEVDFARRKHVRRRPGGHPGLVTYTDFRTIAVRPKT